MRTLLWVGDALSPYRVHLLRAVHRELASRDIDLKLFLMAHRLKGRPWEHDPAELGFPSRTFPGLQVLYDNAQIHLNPRLVVEALREPADWMLVAGGWIAPTSVLTLLSSAALRRRLPLIFWIEANRESMRQRHPALMAYRRSVLRAATALAVPGRVAVETIEQDLGVRGKPYLHLPNIVDESRYRDGVAALRRDRAALRARLDLGPGERVLVWPARLHEAHKGILNFLGAVRDLVPAGLRILVAGEGPDRSRIETQLAAWGLDAVRLLGQQPVERTLELFATADGFLLPSLEDPNPLSVVEALWAGLPLLISNRCGNFPEAVEPGRNGWVVDPASPASMRAAFAELAGGRDEDLRARGEASRVLAGERFATERSVRRFADELEALRR